MQFIRTNDYDYVNVNAITHIRQVTECKPDGRPIHSLRLFDAAGKALGDVADYHELYVQISDTIPAQPGAYVLQLVCEASGRIVTRKREVLAWLTDGTDLMPVLHNDDAVDRIGPEDYLIPTDGEMYLYCSDRMDIEDAMEQFRRSLLKHKK